MPFRQGQEVAPLYMVKQSHQDGEHKIWKGHISRGDNPVRSFENKDDAVDKAKQFAKNQGARGVIVFNRETLRGSDHGHVGRMYHGPAIPDSPAGTLVVRAYSSGGGFGRMTARRDYVVSEEGKDGYLHLMSTYDNMLEEAIKIAEKMRYAEVRGNRPNRRPEAEWTA